MQHLHTREYLSAGTIVQVNCSHQCNVLLMDDTNYSNYKSGRNYKYYGGWRTSFPTQITVPKTGYWNVVIDLAKGSARIQHSIKFIK